MKRYIKEHKVVIAAAIFMLVIIAIAFLAKGAFFTNSKNAVYGNRLDGIEKVKLDSKEKQKLIENIENDSAVKTAKYKLSGRIIDITITVNDDVGIDTAKSLDAKVLEKLSDEQKKFFDIQLFIKKESDAKNFPIIGYKHHNKDKFAWTKDREA